MSRIIAVIIFLALLIPVRMSLKLNHNATENIQEIADKVNREANVQLRKARRTLRINPDAVAKTLKTDVVNMRDSVNASVKNVKEFIGDVLPEDLKPGGSASTKCRESGCLPIRTGLDLTIAAALACLFIVPRKRRR